MNNPLMRKATLPTRALAACLGIIAAGSGAVAFASNATAAPMGTTCGTVVDVPGRTQPVVVLNGDVDCATAMRVADRYLHDPSVQKSGSSGQATVDGWQCSAPVLPGRSRADSYLECDLGGNGFRIGN